MSIVPDTARKLLLIERETPADLDFYRRAIAARHPDLVVMAAATEDAALAMGQDAEILVTKAQTVTPRLFDGLPGLRWIQALTSGIDPIERLSLQPGILITSMQGIHGPQMSELTLLLMLALQRDLPGMLNNQANRTWVRRPQRLLEGQTALIVGVGSIGEALAARLAFLGMRVVGISDGRRTAPNFAEIFPRAALQDNVGIANFVVVLVPYSAATDGMIDRAILRAMRPDAYLINIARGRIVDETALMTALTDGWIAGAGLDVFETEPLPSDSPLWSAPNMIITPHIGGMADCYAEQVLPVLLANLDAYLAGSIDTMVNVARR